ncbi:hypothetical protein PTNB73_10517 [Pyrenophora teres f. teres]|nr:hypothetical protein PTNB73_10517 [Pyrenophora teres f. teres]
MGWLVGMEATNIYKIWIPQSNRVITSRDVRIDEKVLYDPQQSTAPLERSQALSTLLNDIDMNESDEDALPNGSDTAEPVEASAGSRDQEQVAHAFATAQSIRTHRKDLLPPPDFWHQLKRHPEGKGFRHAADAELASLEEKKTFELVDHPDGKQVLPLKWVFTYKFDDAGYLVRHKARICVRGDLQHHVSDDIYAATGAYRSFRILMALVCAFGLLCHQIDFKNAFTNADMDEEIYTTCPPGYSQAGKVWKLRKALYGLRKSPKLWFNELVSFLKGLGFNHCPDEPCILINNQTGLILFLYVDDMLVIAQPECIHFIKDFKLKLNSRRLWKNGYNASPLVLSASTI